MYNLYIFYLEFYEICDNISTGDFMLLRYCDSEHLLPFDVNSYIDIVCLCFIVLCILFSVFVNKRIKLNGRMIIYKIVIKLLVFILIIFAIFTLFIGIKFNSVEGCTCELKPVVDFEPIEDGSAKIEKYDVNRVVIVGDSRFELMEIDSPDLEIPHYMKLIAKSGAGIDWFEKTALPRLTDVLDSAPDDIYYHVVFNMGVNDLNQTKLYDIRIQDYSKLYEKLALEYPNVQFYFLSVNPVDEEIINKYWPKNIRTNGKIKIFNRKILSMIEDNKFGNFKYCDSYNNVDFETYDGLHYTSDTNTRIISYIKNNCIDYKRNL